MEQTTETRPAETQSGNDTQTKSAVSRSPLEKKMRRKTRTKRIIALVVAIALITGVLWFVRRQRQQRGAAQAANQSYITAEVSRRNISADITGSGTLQAANSYSVTTLVQGAILTADFEEGDQVEQGTVLYTIDSSDVSNSLEQAQVSLSQSQRNYNAKLESLENLTVAASVSGRILSLSVEPGDEVNNGQTIATIRNSDVMSLVVPFPEDDAATFTVGQAATITMDSTFETISGTISKIAGSSVVSTGNMIIREVTIDVPNAGGLSTSQSATGAVGGITSSRGATLSYKDEGVVTAKTSGKVERISANEGDWVNKGQTILTLSSTALQNEIQSASESLRNTEISLENQYKRLDDYTITSPISGTIVDKNYKAGETCESNQALCTIYDLSYLTMTLNVDELDISDIEVGQSVTVTADAVQDQVYEGVVTKVSVAGSASGGVTTYPVTIRIEDTDGLLPGMSADATIVLGSVENVLAIPAAALMRGNQVMITADSPSAAGGSTGGFSIERSEGASEGSYSSERPARSTTGERPTRSFTGERPEGMPEGSFTGERPEGMPEGGFTGEWTQSF